MSAEVLGIYEKPAGRVDFRRRVRKGGNLTRGKKIYRNVESRELPKNWKIKIRK